LILRAFLFLAISILIKFLQIVGVQFGVQSRSNNFGHRISLLLLVFQRVVIINLTGFDMFLQVIITSFPVTISIPIKQPQKNCRKWKRKQTP
jgi:hypothetical protein